MAIGFSSMELGQDVSEHILTPGWVHRGRKQELKDTGERVGTGNITVHPHGHSRTGAGGAGPSPGMKVEMGWSPLVTSIWRCL